MSKQSFKSTDIKLQKNDTFYIFSDGYHNQFGGKNNGNFLKFNFKKLLHSIQNKTLKQQKEILYQSYKNWVAFPDKRNNSFNHEQTDDILVVGIKV